MASAVSVGGWWAAFGRWRASLRRQWKAPRRLKFTREGKYFTGMTLLIGFGAVNTGNNLLYLLLGMMLTLIIMSGMLSETVLQGLEVHRKWPERLFAGQAALVEVTLINHKKRAASYSIQILEQIVGVGQKDWPAAYFMHVGAGSQAVSQYRFAYPRRGRWKIEGLEVATRFPFELFRKSRDLGEEQEVLVYPTPLKPPSIQGMASLPQGDVRRHRVGQGGDFHGLRDWRQGDDARSVHWKSTARRGVMVVREFEEEEARTVVLCLANRWPAEASGRAEAGRTVGQKASGQGDGAQVVATRAKLEESVGVCAGLAQDLLARGYAVGVATLDERIEAGTGAAQFDRILRLLALAIFHDAPDEGGGNGVGGGGRQFGAGPRDHCIVVGHGASLPGVGEGHKLGEVKV